MVARGEYQRKGIATKVVGMIEDYASTKGKKIKKEDNHWFGKKHSEETKNKMSIAKKGKQSPRKGAKLLESTIELMECLGEAQK